MSNARRLPYLFASLFLFLLPASLVQAQVTSLTASGDQSVDASTKGAVGNNPFRASLNYTVDPATGMLGITVRFPLAAGSRGPNLGYNFSYSSSFVHPRFLHMSTPPRGILPYPEYAWRNNPA